MRYEGEPIVAGSVTLVWPDPECVSSKIASADLEDDQKRWFGQSEQDGSVMYFCVEAARNVVGQIMLHDIAGYEAMVGYHIFRTGDRQRGYGTDALSGLCAYAFAEMGVRRLIIITSLDNQASRRIAQKCGFSELGPAREGAHLIVYERAR